MTARVPKQFDLVRHHDADWMADGACRDSWLDFVPDSKHEAQPALAECRASCCPVRTQCLTYGLETRAYGVWGGQYLAWGQVKAA